MLTIRLARGGAKKRPFYHIVVAEKTSPRDGRFIERLGFSNPLAAGQAEPLRLNLARYEHWREVGAEPSATVMRLVRTAKRKQEAAAQKAATQEIAAQEAAAEVAAETKSGDTRSDGTRNRGARNRDTRSSDTRNRGTGNHRTRSGRTRKRRPPRLRQQHLWPPIKLSSDTLARLLACAAGYISIHTAAAATPFYKTAFGGAPAQTDHGKKLISPKSVRKERA